MTDDALIASQTREIARLKGFVEVYQQAMRDIHMQLCGIGGPLNDNKHGYTAEQLKPFQNIAALIDIGFE